MPATFWATRDIRLITPSDDEGACDVFLKVFTGPPGPTPASLLQNIKDTKVMIEPYMAINYIIKRAYEWARSLPC